MNFFLPGLDFLCIFLLKYVQSLLFTFTERRCSLWKMPSRLKLDSHCMLEESWGKFCKPKVARGQESSDEYHIKIFKQGIPTTKPNSKTQEQRCNMLVPTSKWNLKELFSVKPQSEGERKCVFVWWVSIKLQSNVIGLWPSLSLPLNKPEVLVPWACPPDHDVSWPGGSPRRLV